MEKKKILILYAPLGAGHGMAATALEEAFNLYYPDFEVKNISVLDFTFDIFKRTLPKAFFYITLKMPFLYTLIYKYYNSHNRLGSLNNISDAMLKGSRFVNFLKDFNPDFIVATNPLPAQLVSKTKEKNIIDILSANVCTDYGFHSFWHNADVNYYFVANEEIKKSLVKHGVKEASIMVTGIPIKQKFKNKLDRQEVLEKLGFNSSVPVILVVGGKMNYRNLLKILKGVENKNENAQFILIAGRDEKLEKQLKQSPIKDNPKVRIFGFVDNIDEYMDASDLILTKAGGLTVSECLAKGLPMVINDIIPAQEEDNVDYLIKNKAGIDARSEKSSIDGILKLLFDSSRLQEMKQNCRSIAKPDAAKEIVDFVVSKIK